MKACDAENLVHHRIPSVSTAVKKKEIQVERGTGAFELARCIFEKSLPDLKIHCSDDVFQFETPFSNRQHTANY